MGHIPQLCEFVRGRFCLHAIDGATTLLSIGTDRWSWFLWLRQSVYESNYDQVNKTDHMILRAQLVLFEKRLYMQFFFRINLSLSPAFKAKWRTWNKRKLRMQSSSSSELLSRSGSLTSADWRKKTSRFDALHAIKPKASAENDLALIRCCFQVPEMLVANFHHSAFFTRTLLWCVVEVVLRAEDFTYSAGDSCRLRIV